MFLDMLTADAASKHGHEFSDNQPGPHQPRWLPRRSPLRVLPYGTRPRFPPRARSQPAAMAELKEEPEDPDAAESCNVSPYHDCSVEDLPIPGSYRHASPPKSPILEEPPQLPQPLDVQTSTAIVTQPTDIPHHVKPDRRSHRSKTQYLVAHPPPSGSLKKQTTIRPRPLFQLQRPSSARFYRPEYEICAINRFDASKTFGQRLRRLGKGKDHAHSNDLAILRVGDYAHPAASFDGEVSESRDIMAIICPLPYEQGLPVGRAQILLENSSWLATPSRNGVYDLKSTADDGLFSARWYVPKSQRKKLSDPMKMDSRFYYASIRPGTKKHPTMASMSQSYLDVYDAYTCNADSCQPLAQPNDAAVASDADLSNVNGHAVPLDELNRCLIIASSFWVMLCEGWSPHFAFPSTVLRSSTPTPSTVNRRVSMPCGKDLDRLGLDGISNPKAGFRAAAASAKHTCRSSSVDQGSSKRLSLTSFSRRVSSATPSVRSSSAEPGSAPESAVASARVSISDTPDERRIVDDSQAQQAGLELDSVSQENENDKIAAIPFHPPTSVSNTESSIFSRFPTPTSHLTDDDSVLRRRSRSVSWTWSLSLPRKAKLEKEQDCPTPIVMSHPNKHIAVAGSNDDRQGSNFQGSGTDDGTYTTANEAAVSTYLAPAPTRDDCEIDDSGKLAGRHDGEVIKTQTQTSKRVSFVDTHADSNPTTSPDTNQDKRWSTDSSDLEMHVPVVGAPYWKDFDRIQSQQFENQVGFLEPPLPTQDRPLPAPVDKTSASSIADVAWVHEKPLTPTPAIQGDCDTGKVTEQAPGGWFAGIRRSVSRRRPRSFAGIENLQAHTA